MAVQVVCYEIFQYLENAEVQVSTTSRHLSTQVAGLGSRVWDKDPASGQQIEGLMQHLESVMAASGYIDKANPGHSVTRMRRLFMRQQLDETEVQILRGMLKAIERNMN